MPHPRLRSPSATGRIGATAWATVLLLGGVAAFDAAALSVGRLVTQSSLGQPLNLVFPLSLSAGDERLTRECVRADVMAGENRVPPGLLQFQLEGEGERIRAVRVLSTVPVDEPIVSVSLSLGCPTRYTRQFTAFIDPPELRPTLQAAAVPLVPAAMPAPTPPPAPPPAPQAAIQPAPQPAAEPTPTPAPASQRVAAAERPPVPPPKPKPRPKPKLADKPPAPVLAQAPLDEDSAPAKAGKASKPVARLRLDPVEPPVQTLAAAAGPQAASAAAAASEPVSAAMPDPVLLARLELMEKQLGSVQLEHRLTEEKLKLVRAQLEAAQTDRYQHLSTLALMLAVLGLGAACFYLWRTRQVEKQLREAVWWREEHERSKLDSRPPAPPPPKPVPAPAPAPRAAATVDEFEAQTLAGPLLEDPHALPELPGVEETEDTQTQTTPLPLMQDPISFVGMSTRPMPMPMSVPAPSPSERVLEQLHAQQPAEAQSQAPLSVEELIDLEQQVDFFIVLGQDEAAIELLQSRIDTGEASALPYLKLLEIHQRSGDGLAFAALAASFADRFQAVPPSWGSAMSEGRGLEAYAPVMRLLQQHWINDAGVSMALVQNLLARGGEDAQGFELPAYRDLLMLYAVARDLSEREVRGGDIDVFLPLDGRAGPPGGASPTSMMATMVWQATPALVGGASSYGSVDVDITLDDGDTTTPGVRDV